MNVHYFNVYTCNVRYVHNIYSCRSCNEEATETVSR